ncbi:hypothetical protein PENTCL1PPCAC_16425, partial [Pristionchus entomophagus]
MASLEDAVLLFNICMSILSISLNILLTFIVFRNTPSKFSTFGIILKFHALIDLYISVGSSATMIRIIPVDWFVLYISYGPCGYFGTTACFFFSIMMIGGMSINLHTILASFIYRLMMIRGKTLSTKGTLGIICAIAMRIATILMTFAFISREDDDVVRSLLNALRPQYDADSHVVTGISARLWSTQIGIVGHKDIRSV